MGQLSKYLIIVLILVGCSTTKTIISVKVSSKKKSILNVLSLIPVMPTNTFKPKFTRIIGTNGPANTNLFLTWKYPTNAQSGTVFMIYQTNTLFPQRNWYNWTLMGVSSSNSFEFRNTNILGSLCVIASNTWTGLTSN
jgi:hypothetical protein